MRHGGKRLAVPGQFRQEGHVLGHLGHRSGRERFLEQAKLDLDRHRLGSYGDALDSAARRAGLGKDYRVDYVERPVSRVERFLQLMGASSAQAVTIQVRLGLLEEALPAGPVAEVAQDMAFLSELTRDRKPFAAVTHCLCGLP